MPSLCPKSPRTTWSLKHDHFYDEVPERPEYVVHGTINDLLRACPHHGFLELHQLDTFYNALNSNDQDSLNSAAGVSLSQYQTPGISPDVAELKDMVKALLLEKKNQTQAPTPVKAVEESCVTCGGTHSYRNCPATDGNVYRDNIQEYVSQAASANFNQGNTSYRASIANQIRPPGEPNRSIIEMACEVVFAQEVLVIIFLDEVYAFLALEDDPTSPEVDDSYYDSEGIILTIFETFLKMIDHPLPI
ncbi:hypothetical protein Tco_0698165 [Tanacetum coccineum]